MNKAKVDDNPNTRKKKRKGKNKEDVDMSEREEMLIKEGKAEAFYPPCVFYNPVQEFNRDLTIAVISQFAQDHFKSQDDKRKKKTTSKEETMETDQTEANLQDEQGKDTDKVNLVAGKHYTSGLRILEGLSASGLRSVRFGLEIPGVKEIIANDFDKSAVEIIQRNITLNKMDHLIKSNYGDAAMVMYENRQSHSIDKRFDVIDLDPYGSPHLFLDAAVQAVSEGGLLCITCTDAAVLCGKAPETCLSKYGSVSLKSKFCHEMGLRIILRSIESHANRYSRYTVPILSVSVDFYFRVFVRVFSGQGKVKRSIAKLASTYVCVGCGAFHLQKIGELEPTKGEGNYKYLPGKGPCVKEKCENCGFRHTVGGPVWVDPMHSPEFIQKVIDSVNADTSRFKTSKRILGILSMANEELHDVPFYYETDELFNILHCNPLNFIAMRSAILNAGYRVSSSHCAKNSIKTDAPSKVIWDILRAWVKENPVNESRMVDGSVTKAILSQPCSTKVSFDIHPHANPASRAKGLIRWQVNPEKNWGPKPRAKRYSAPSSNQSITNPCSTLSSSNYETNKPQHSENTTKNCEETDKGKNSAEVEYSTLQKANSKILELEKELADKQSQLDKISSEKNILLSKLDLKDEDLSSSNTAYVYKTDYNQPCKHFVKKGKCRLGDECKFVHDIHNVNTKSSELPKLLDTHAYY